MSQIQREHPRYAHEAAVTLHVGGRVVEGRTRNISRGGLCADLADPIAVGADLDVDIVLVFEDDAQSEPLRVPARVVWCTSLNEGHHVGLTFRPLDAGQLDYLSMFLRYLDEGDAEEPARATTVDDRFG